MWCRVKKQPKPVSQTVNKTWSKIKQNTLADLRRGPTNIEDSDNDNSIFLYLRKKVIL